MSDEQHNLFQIINRVSSLKTKLENLLTKINDKNAKFLHQECSKCKSCFVYQKQSSCESKQTANSKNLINMDGNLSFL